MSGPRPRPAPPRPPRPQRQPVGAGGRSPRALPPLHLLVDDHLLAAADLRERLDPILAAGGPVLALHLRGRRVAARQLHDAAAAVTALARTHGATVIVNDRLDVALAVGADGVHLREDSLPGGVARRLAGEGLWLGRSIHDPARARTREGTDLRALDYLVLGTIYPTPSHPGRAPIGTGALARAAAWSDRPVLAIGGITPERVAAARGCGAAGVVVRSGVWGSGGEVGAVQRYLEALAT